MRCDDVRESLSAILDGEDPEHDRDRVEEHLRWCSGCRRWHDDAARVNRIASLAPAGDGAVAPSALVEAVMGAYRVPVRARLRLFVRAGLFVVALVQLGIGVLGLLPTVATPGGGHVGHDALPGVDGHLGNEASAFNLAVGAALLWVTARPHAARGPLPLLAAFVLTLAALSALDVASGQVGWGRLASHLPVLAGVLLAGALARLHRVPDPMPGRTRSHDDDVVPVPEHGAARWAPVVHRASDKGRRPPAAGAPAA